MPLASFVLTAALVSGTSCPVTIQPTPHFRPPLISLGDAEPSSFWFGTADFWTMLPANGLRARRDKLFWWQLGYNGAKEPTPAITITLKQIDSGVTSFGEARPTNAFFNDAWSMLTMPAFPSAGCWQVTGTYNGRSLTFITEVQ